MGSVSGPSHSSMREQEALRMNSIEGTRLDRRLQLIEKQGKHSERLISMRMRLTRLTLDHIAACSETNVEKGPEAGSYKIRSEEPLFLYGERTSSRKIPRGKARKAQSATMLRRAATSTGERKKQEPTSRRPKTAAPSFQEVETKVMRQMDINPDWDPNVDDLDAGHESDGETSVWHDSKSVAWAHDINSRSGSAVMKSRPTSKQQAKKIKSEATQESATHAAAGAGDARSWRGEKPTKNGSKTLAKRPMTSVGFLVSAPMARKENDEKTRPRTSKPRMDRSLEPVTEDGELEFKGKQSVRDHSRNQVPVVAGDKTTSEHPASAENNQAYPTPPNSSQWGRQPHPMTEIVASARRLAGRAKRLDKALVDDDSGQFSTPAEKKKEEMKAKLEMRKNENLLMYRDTLNSVKLFLSKKFPTASLRVGSPQVKPGFEPSAEETSVISAIA